MKRFLFLVTFACVAMFAACEYDDSALWGEIDGVKQELADHERRIAALEELCKQMNTNISALQTAVTALQNNDFVTNVAPITKDGETIGYTVTFSKSGSITIYNGEDGKDGADGEDAVAPVIGVKQDSDGVYYWTLDGEWLTDDAGNKIKAEGKDGKDGEDGEDATDGEDGVTPQLKIEDDYWYVSYDNGATWKRLGKATGNSSTNVTDCNCIIKDVRQDDDNVYFELTDGTIITIPKSNGDNNSGDNGDDGDTSATLPPSNEIWYTSTDGKIVTPYKTDVFGANIVSNTYEDGKGVIEFDGDVTEIGFTAFKTCGTIMDITLPEYVTKIDRAAFKECTNLKSIHIPDGVVLIGDEAFEECRNLENIIIPNGVISLDYEVFRNCSSLKSIVIPQSVTAIKWRALSLCSSLTNISIPNSVISIEQQAFTGCSGLTSITIPDGVVDIGNMTFANCSNLLTVIIGEGVASIGSYAFYNCSSLTNVKIGSNVTSIGRIAFQNCSSLTSINIPDGVTSIGDSAFYSCTNLASVTIPVSVTSIASYTFQNCSNLTSVYCKPTIPPSASIIGGLWQAFTKIGPSAKIYVPIGSGDAYKTADYWSDYASMIEEMAM